MFCSTRLLLSLVILVIASPPMVDSAANELSSLVSCCSNICHWFGFYLAGFEFRTNFVLWKFQSRSILKADLLDLLMASTRNHCSICYLLLRKFHLLHHFLLNNSIRFVMIGLLRSGVDGSHYVYNNFCLYCWLRYVTTNVGNAWEAYFMTSCTVC